MYKWRKVALLLAFPAAFSITAFACEWKWEEGSERAQERRESSRESETENRITVQVGEQAFEVVLYDNASAEELRSRLPLTIPMDELNGNEKFYYLPEDLPADRKSVGRIHTGDLMLFGSDCLVLFYENFTTSYQYTELGRVEDPAGLKEALGNGSIDVIFR